MNYKKLYLLIIIGQLFNTCNKVSFNKKMNKNQKYLPIKILQNINFNLNIELPYLISDLEKGNMLNGYYICPKSLCNNDKQYSLLYIKNCLLAEPSLRNHKFHNKNGDFYSITKWTYKITNKYNLFTTRYINKNRFNKNLFPFELINLICNFSFDPEFCFLEYKIFNNTEIKNEQVIFFRKFLKEDFYKYILCSTDSKKKSIDKSIKFIDSFIIAEALHKCYLTQKYFSNVRNKNNFFVVIGPYEKYFKMNLILVLLSINKEKLTKNIKMRCLKTSDQNILLYNHIVTTENLAKLIELSLIKNDDNFALDMFSLHYLPNIIRLYSFQEALAKTKLSFNLKYNDITDLCILLKEKKQLKKKLNNKSLLLEIQKSQFYYKYDFINDLLKNLFLLNINLEELKPECQSTNIFLEILKKIKFPCINL